MHIVIGYSLDSNTISQCHAVIVSGPRGGKYVLDAFNSEYEKMPLSDLAKIYRAKVLYRKSGLKTVTVIGSDMPEIIKFINKYNYK